jgi:hypothetical protein
MVSGCLVVVVVVVVVVLRLRLGDSIVSHLQVE